MLRGLRAKVVFIQCAAAAAALILIGIVLYQVEKKDIESRFIDSADTLHLLLRIQSGNRIADLRTAVDALQEGPKGPLYSQVLLAGSKDGPAIAAIAHMVPPLFSEKIKTMLGNCEPGFVNASRMQLLKLFAMHGTNGTCTNLVVVSDSGYLTKELLLFIEVIGAYILLNLFILVVISWFVIDRYTVVPLQRFEQAVEGVSSGDYPQLKAMPRAAELHRIVQAFDTMTSAIRTKQKSLTDTIQELKETRELAVRRERLAAIGSLSSGISHEIGNPLSAILSILETLKESIKKDSAAPNEAETESRVDMINRSLAEAYRIDALIKQLLLYVRQKPVAVTDVDIAALVRDVMASVESSRDCKDVKMSLDIEPGMVCKTDYEKLRQVLVNLATNALDAMNGKGRLGIRAAHRNGTHSIEVSDTGEGIAQENLDKIFEPFFTTKPSGKGTGMGLAIVKNLVQDLGGEITVSSSQSSGTVFTITLPHRGH